MVRILEMGQGGRMQLPGPLRAAVGLAADVADEARRLPDRAIELPMLAVSSVLQLSLRAQQRYAALTVRGDEVLGRRPTDEPPAWATFDDDPLPEPGPGAAGPTAARLLDEILGPVTGPSAKPEPAEDVAPPTPITAARSGARTGPAKKAPRKAAPARKATGKSVSKPRHTAPSKFDDAGD
jgi:hypothetical protein